MKRFIEGAIVGTVLLALVSPTTFAGGGSSARFALWTPEESFEFFRLDLTGDGQPDTIGASSRIEITPADAEGMVQARLRLLFQARDFDGSMIGELSPPLTLPTMSYPDPGNQNFQEEGLLATVYQGDFGQIFPQGGTTERRRQVAERFVDDEILIGMGRAFAGDSSFLVIGIANGGRPCFRNELTENDCVPVGTFNVFVYETEGLTLVCSRWFESEGPLGELVDVLGGVGDYDADGSDEIRVAWEAEGSAGRRFIYKYFDVASCERDGAPKVFTVRGLDNIPVSNHGPRKPVPFID